MTLLDNDHAFPHLGGNLRRHPVDSLCDQVVCANVDTADRGFNFPGLRLGHHDGGLEPRSLGPCHVQDAGNGPVDFLGMQLCQFGVVLQCHPDASNPHGERHVRFDPRAACRLLHIFRCGTKFLRLGSDSSRRASAPGAALRSREPLQDTSFREGSVQAFQPVRNHELPHRVERFALLARLPRHCVEESEACLTDMCHAR